MTNLIPTPRQVVKYGVIVLIVLFLLKYLPTNIKNQFKY